MHNPAATTNTNPADEQLIYLIARARYRVAVHHCNLALLCLGPIPNPATDPIAFQVWATLARRMAEGYKLLDLKTKLDRAEDSLLAWGKRELTLAWQLPFGIAFLLDCQIEEVRKRVLNGLAHWDWQAPYLWR